MAKEFARSFYSSKAWQDCRNEYAKRRHHLCENCLRRGIYKPGVIVHHIEELTPFNITNPEIALGLLTSSSCAGSVIFVSMISRAGAGRK